MPTEQIVKLWVTPASSIIAIATPERQGIPDEDFLEFNEDGLYVSPDVLFIGTWEDLKGKVTINIFKEIITDSLEPNEAKLDQERKSWGKLIFDKKFPLTKGRIEVGSMLGNGMVSLPVDGDSSLEIPLQIFISPAQELNIINILIRKFLASS